MDALKPTKIVTGVDVGKDTVEAVLAKEVGDVTFDLVINVAGILNVRWCFVAPGATCCAHTTLCYVLFGAMPGGQVSNPPTHPHCYCFQA